MTLRTGVFGGVDVPGVISLGEMVNGALGGPTYAEILRDDYRASEVWPLVDITAGVNIPAFINSARDGTLTGWDLQNAAGPVPGSLAPYSDGLNDFGDIYTSNGSTGLVDIVDFSIGSVFIWFEPDNWADPSQDTLFDFRTTTAKEVVNINKLTTNTLRFIGLWGGVSVSEDVAITPGTTGQIMAGMSWNKPANEFKAFLNGVQTPGGTQAIAGVVSGESLSRALIGAVNNAPLQNVLAGNMSYLSMIFGSVWSPTDFQNMHNAAATARPDL